MTKIKEYIIKNLKEFTDLHSSDINENNLDINDLQYSYNYNEVKAATDMIGQQIYKGTNHKIVCDIMLCECGEISIHFYDNIQYKEVLHFYLTF